MAEPKQLYRIVIGAYGAAERAASATSDLCQGGMSHEQVCLISKPPLPLDPPRAAADPLSNLPRWPLGVDLAHADTRQIGDHQVEVSAPALFDRVIKAEAAEADSLTPWMTRAQSKAILDSLGSGALLLLVSASTASEQVRASQVQLTHHPSIMQSYSFLG
jgi:hypothetical protein